MDGAVPATRTGPVGAYAALILAAAGVYYLHAARPQTDQSMAVASLLVSALCLTAVTRVWGRSLLQGPVLYLSLFLIFHLGIAWTLGFGGYEAVRQISPTAFQWIRSGYLPAAVTLACGGALVFSAVCTLLPPKQSGGQIPREAAKGPPDVPPDQGQLARSLGATGVALELVGLGLVLSSVISAGGVELLFGGYLQFLESAQPGDLAYGIWAIGVGASLSQLGTRGARRTGVTVFLLFSLVMFPLGLRGSVLFPAAVLLATRAALGERLRAAYLGVGVLAVLTLSAVVRTTRIGGAGSAGEWYRAPISTITELGFSLRPAVEVLRWQDMGLPHSWFISFVAVPVRLVERVTGWHGGPPTIDNRLFNVKVLELAGPIGGSPVAEGYDAAGVLGAGVIMATIAIVICLISRHFTRSATHMAMFPVVMLPLLIAVRNSFTPVLVQITVGGALLLLIRKLSPRHEAGERERARPAGQGDMLLAR